MTAPSQPRPRGGLTATGKGLVVLVAGAVLLTLLSLGLPQVTDDGFVVAFVVVTEEANLPTWFNVVLLAWGALLHAAVGVLARTDGHPAWPWFGSAFVLAALSLDDLSSLHERLEGIGRSLGGGDGVTHFAWVLPGAVLAGVVVLGCVAAVPRIPRPSAVLLALGIGLLLAAAVGLEMAGGAILAGNDGGTSVGYLLVSHVEEFLETVAAVILLAAASSAVRWHRDGDGLRLTYRAGRRAPRPGRAGHPPREAPGGTAGDVPSETSGDVPRRASGG